MHWLRDSMTGVPQFKQFYSVQGGTYPALMWKAHMDVIHTLVEHYQQDCKSRDCLGASEHLRFLEKAYEAEGGGKYLYMLFDAMPEVRGVLVPIHELAGLPSLRLETDKGFGTSL